MKKIVIALLITILVVVTVVPFGVGHLAKRSLEKRIASINLLQAKKPSPVVRLALDDYQQGWYHSTAKLKVYLEWSKFPPALLLHLVPMLNIDQKTASPLYPLVVDLAMNHGPVIIQNKNPAVSRVQFGLGFVETALNLPWNEQGKQWVNGVLGQQELLSSTSLISYSGNFSTSIVVPTVHYADTAGDIKIDWSGLALSSQVSNDQTKASINLNLTPVKVSHVNGVKVLDSSAFTLVGETQQGLLGIWFGNVAAKIDSLVLSNNGSPHFALLGLNAVSSTSIDKESLALSLNYQVDNIFAGGQSYGPSQLLLQINGVGAKHYKAITDTLAGSNYDAMPQEQLMLLGMQLLPEFTQMLEGATLSLLFNTKAPEGNIDFKLTLAIAKSDGAVKDPMKIVRDSIGKCTFTVPKLLFKKMLAMQYETVIKSQMLSEQTNKGGQPDLSQAPQLADQAADHELATAVQAGWISVTETTYTGIYEYRAGKLYSGNKEMIDLLAKFQAFSH